MYMSSAHCFYRQVAFDNPRWDTWLESAVIPKLCESFDIRAEDMPFIVHTLHGLMICESGTM